MVKPTYFTFRSQIQENTKKSRCDWSEMMQKNTENDIESIVSIKISVIIPIFNHEKYIVECLQSIEEQKDKCFEIIAVDDGSSDKSYELSMRYLSCNLPSKNWKLSTRSNKGINKTLNEAIKKSSGEIIFLLASDDRLPPDSLKMIREAYINEEEKNKLFFYDVSLINWKGERIKESLASDRRGKKQLLASSKLHLAAQVLLGWGRLFGHQFYSREFFEKYGPYPEDLKYEDVYLALTAVSVDKFCFMPLLLKEYRLREDESQTPGLTCDDLNQANISLDKNNMKYIKWRYKFLFYFRRVNLTTQSIYTGSIIAKVSRVIKIICILLGFFGKYFRVFRRI